MVCWCSEKPGLAIDGGKGAWSSSHQKKGRLKKKKIETRKRDLEKEVVISPESLRTLKTLKAPKPSNPNHVTSHIQKGESGAPTKLNP